MSYLFPVLTVLLYIYWVLVIVAIIAEDRDATTSLAWIAVLVLLPGPGLVLYFFAGRDWKGWLSKRAWALAWGDTRMRFMDRIYSTHAAFSKATHRELEGTLAEKVATTIETVNYAPPLPGRDLIVYPEGDEYFSVLIADLLSAQRTIQMQYFIWEHDELTARITEALHDRLKAGVKVYILNDFLGCLTYNKSELRGLRDAGAQVSWDMTQLGRLNYRNHRKLTVIDGLVGHSGGFNIGQEYIDGGKKYPAWRDTGMRFEGPIVVELAKLFADRWYEVEREELLDDGFFRAGLAVDDAANLPMQVVAHGVEDPRESARRAHAVAIAGARERVWMQSPYFIPDVGTYDAILNAAYSGVDVRLMMTDWPDKKLALYAAESYYLPLLLAGGRIFRYTKGFFHAKSLTVDGTVSAIGTMNLDMRSLKLHKELMVWCYSEQVARRCEEIFLDDLEDCREITVDEIEQWSAASRFRNSAARLLSNVM